MRRDLVGQAAVGAQAGGIAGGPEGLRAVGAAVCARAGVIHHPQLQPVGGGSVAQLLLLGVLEHRLVCGDESIQEWLSTQRYYKPFNSQY